MLTLFMIMMTLVQEPAQPITQPEQAALIDINTATAETLDTLPGIGPVKAAAIVAYRTEHGPFETVDTLVKVKGIGPKTLAKLKPLISASKPKEQ